MSNWIKASASNPSGNCVEARACDTGGVMLRNSRFPDGDVLLLTTEEWLAFVAGVKDGEFDFG